jgi:muramoyltetrapeptide carboxypeptidase
VILPTPLVPGDRIAVVAPSSSFERRAVESGIAWLKERYRVSYGASLFTREGYLAGTDRRRRAELQRAFDSEARAVVAARGGYGLSRIAHLLDWKKLLTRGCWLVGFSDFTVLHVEAWRRGLCSIHGPMVSSLSAFDAAERERWLGALEQPSRAVVWGGLSTWRRGRASGPLVGGNLAMLHACAAAGRLRIPAGAIVMLEDIGERPYRVDRMLTNLMTSGHLARASGFVVGRFTDCAPGPDQRTVESVVRERLRGLGVPIVADAPMGHGGRNDPVVLGRRGEIEAGRGLFSLLR